MEMLFPAFFIHRNSQGAWTWKLAVAEGVTVAASTVTYRSQQECASAVKTVREARGLAVFGTVDDLTNLASSVVGVSQSSSHLEDELILAAESSNYRFAGD